jgi:thiamine thiazole synthase
MEKFSKISEAQITRAIVREFTDEFIQNTKTDVIIIGGGPSGLMAARDLASSGIRTLIIEANNYLGGGFWIGGYLMNKLTIRKPGQEILDELEIPYKEVEKGLYVADGPHACSKLIAAACDAGVKIVNMTKFDDVVLRENNKVSGVVVNWTAVDGLPRSLTCCDPVALESKLVIDATGHDAVVCSALETRGIIELEGFGAMWVEASEDLIVENTKEIHPGLIVCGMSVATAFGVPRMGPTFAGMLASGRQAAKVAKTILAVEEVGKETIRI